MTRLTLSVDERVVEDAKRLARQSGRSVSAMFSEFVRAMARPERSPTPLGPLTRKAIGLAKMPENKTYRAVLEEALLERHGIEP